MKKLIKKFNAWMEKVGVDRLLHFSIAAWIVAECKMYGIGAAGIGFVVLMILSFLKEKLGGSFDGKDFWYSACGGFTSLLLAIPKDLF